MPRSTIQYPFENKVFFWASGFSARLTGSGFYGFLMLLDERGPVKRVHVGSLEREFDYALKETLIEGEVSWIFYDPFDAPEYGSIEWQNVPRPVMERLMGSPFVDTDFGALRGASRCEYPESWSAMY